MSHYMTALAMRQTGLKPATKIVLYWLADHHNETTGRCFPSIARLAQVCEMSRRSVEQHLNDLEAAGLVERVQRCRPEGGKTSNAYTLRLVESDAQNLRMPTAKSAHEDAQNLRMNNLGRYNLGIEQEDISCARDGFDEFWQAYPRKTVKSAARKAYAKAVKKARHDDIMFGLSQHLPALQAKEQQFIPHPATWLNQERWNDEPEQPDNRINRNDARAHRPGAGMAQAFASVAERLSRDPTQGGSGSDGFV